MIKNQVVEGTIYIKYNFKENFPTSTDEDDIIEYIKNHFLDILTDDDAYELDDVSIDSIQVDDYAGDDEYGI